MAFDAAATAAVADALVLAPAEPGVAIVAEDADDDDADVEDAEVLFLEAAADEFFRLSFL